MIELGARDIERRDRIGVRGDQFCHGFAAMAVQCEPTRTNPRDIELLYRVRGNVDDFEVANRLVPEHPRAEASSLI